MISTILGPGLYAVKLPAGHNQLIRPQHCSILSGRCTRIPPRACIDKQGGHLFCVADTISGMKDMCCCQSRNMTMVPEAKGRLRAAAQTGETWRLPAAQPWCPGRLRGGGCQAPHILPHQGLLAPADPARCFKYQWSWVVPFEDLFRLWPGHDAVECVSLEHALVVSDEPSSC